ncbi:WD40 repeat-like protein, partial [Suillus brevipes Sb2]
NPKTKITGHPASAKHKISETKPYRKIEVDASTKHILHLPGGQRVITYSWNGSFRMWDMERGAQVGEEWEDKDFGVETIALSPDGKTIANGSMDGTVKLWNIDTGKVIKNWTGDTILGVESVGCQDGAFVVWNVTESEESILGPIKAGNILHVVCYSTDGEMIATGGDDLKIWDADAGKLLKIIEGGASCLAWTSDGKTLIAGGIEIRKINTATWSQIAVIELDENFAKTILLSPNEHILASISLNKTVQLWNLETIQPIGTPLHHEDDVISATFSADGKFLATSCTDGHYTWDVSAILKDAGLLSDIVDATPRPVSKTKGARRIPQGFFDDALRDANLRTRLSQSRGPHTNSHPTSPPHQRAHSRFSFWHRSRPHGATEPDTHPRSHPLSWTRSIVSGMLRRQDRSDIELQEPPVVDVPYTAGKPRNYHARKKKPDTSSSRPPKTHNTQQHSGATQNTSSSQPQPPTATTNSYVTVRVAGWRARFMVWVCCIPIQNTNGQP